MYYNEAALRKLYQKIEEAGRPAILAGGLPDGFLACPGRDARRSVALLLRPSPATADRIAESLEDLRAAAPEIYIYPRPDLHVTVLDLLRGREGLVCPPELAERYAEAIRQVAAAIPPFQVVFRGMTASSEAVLVKGYYEPALETLRQELRAALRRRELSLEERYTACSCHITVARFPKTLQSPQRLLEALEHLGERTFGDFTADSLELVFHNWYDSQKECLARFRLTAV